MSAQSLDSGSEEKIGSEKISLPADMPESTRRFVTGVASGGGTKTTGGGISFLILQPQTIFDLILGKNASLVEVTLPEFSFEFFYRQVFPIIGPLSGTFAGGVSGRIQLTFGYDTFGFRQFAASKNAALLVNGFYVKDADGPEAQLSAEIAVGAALSIAIATVGVEGGIRADIFFDISDLDGDAKVRIGEMAANMFANSYNPLAIFDISGMISLFLRAYVEINLFITSIKFEYEFPSITIFEFNIPFKRPGVLASQSGDTLTLNIGPSAKARLNGDTSDGNETIFAKSAGGGIVVWSDQFNMGETAASITPFVGVKTHRRVRRSRSGHDRSQPRER